MDKYKWDLTKFYKNKEEFNKEIDEVNRLLEELSKYKGKILESDKTLLEVLELDSKIDLLIERLYVYSFLGYYDNMEDPEFQDYKERAISAVNKAYSERTFINPEILSSSYEKVLGLISKNKDLAKYKFNISPRRNIDNIKNKCIQFVNNFDNPEYKNLLFVGSTGLR